MCFPFFIFPNMKKHLIFYLISMQVFLIHAQTNLNVTNSVADQVIKGNFDPLQFSSTNTVSDHQQMIQYLQNSIEPDSLKAHIVKMATFHNRNTGSDTVSTTTGIGAARRWAYGKFEQFSSASENRLIPSYFQMKDLVLKQLQWIYPLL